MGNCQAAEAAAAAAVVIQDPRGGGNKVQKIHRVVSANEVMNSNPGHYVAMVIAAPPVKQLKLLRPADTLLLGHVYRLISFEDVLKEFAARKCVKLGKLLKQIEASNVEINKHQHRNSSNNASPKAVYVFHFCDCTCERLLTKVGSAEVWEDSLVVLEASGDQLCRLYQSLGLN